MRPRAFRPFATRRGARKVKQLRGAGAALDNELAAASSPVDGSHPRVLGSGDRAFRAILDRVSRAESTVEIRAFLWRDDEAGNLLAEAVLRAADRGAQVAIHKDRIAAVYEYMGGNKQSFFHKRVDPIRGLQAWLLGSLGVGAKGSIRQRPNPLAERIIGHDRIRVEHNRKRFDHSKLFIIDERYLALGSMGIGDNHRHEWIDVMVEADGPEHVARLRERMNGGDEFDPSRGIDFLVHSREAHRRRSCPMISHRLALIDSAQTSLTVEMAYLGDRRFTAALARAVTRGCHVKLVTAENADVLGATNRATCDLLLRTTGAPDNLKVVVLPRMVHSKVVVIDHRFADVGSANFTALSHGVYDEINLYADSEPFAADLEAEIDRHCEEGKLAAGRIAYKKMFSGIEKAVVAYQSRRGG